MICILGLYEALGIWLLLRSEPWNSSMEDNFSDWTTSWLFVTLGMMLQAVNLSLWIIADVKTSHARFYGHYTLTNTLFLVMIPIHAPTSLEHLTFASINLMVLLLTALLNMFAGLSVVKAMLHLTVFAFLQMLITGIRWTKAD